MNVPRLRFKDDGREFSEWKTVRFGDVAIFSKGKGISKADIAPDGITPCIRYGELYTEYSETIHKIKSRTNIDPIQLQLSEANDVIIPASGETQLDIARAACVLSEGVALGGDLNIIKSNENGVFLSYYLNHQKKLDIAKLSQGNSVVHLYSSQLKLLDLIIPSKPEQTKIANFLTAIDEKITQLTQKYDLLAQYKKGVMQQIFSQKLRFKDEDGREFRGWEETTLGEATELFSRRNKNLIDAEVYSVTNSNGFVLQTEHFEDRVIAGSDLSNYKIIYQGEFAYNPARVNVGSIALFTEQVGVISSLYVCFKCKPSVDNTFLLNYLELDSTKQNINSFGEGGVRIYLWYPLFSQIPISLPSLKEQTRIANFLTAIDDKITHTKTQLDAVKQYKKGLLQQLFV